MISGCVCGRRLVCFIRSLSMDKSSVPLSALSNAASGFLHLVFFFSMFVLL